MDVGVRLTRKCGKVTLDKKISAENIFSTFFSPAPLSVSVSVRFVKKFAFFRLNIKFTALERGQKKWAERSGFSFRGRLR
jgi:hypothetical protein